VLLKILVCRYFYYVLTYIPLDICPCTAWWVPLLLPMLLLMILCFYFTCWYFPLIIKYSWFLASVSSLLQFEKILLDLFCSSQIILSTSLNVLMIPLNAFGLVILFLNSDIFFSWIFHHFAYITHLFFLIFNFSY
jgi:hypothetical protein